MDLVEVQRFFGCQAAAWSKRNIWTHGIALNCLHSSWMQLAGWAVLICLAGYFFSPCLWHCSQLFLHLALLTCVLPSNFWCTLQCRSAQGVSRQATLHRHRHHRYSSLHQLSAAKACKWFRHVPLSCHQLLIQVLS